MEFHNSPGWEDVWGPPQPPRPWGWPWGARCSWWRDVECPVWRAWCRQAPTAKLSSVDRTPCSGHACERVPARSLRSSAAVSHACISRLRRHRGRGSIRLHGVHSLHHVFGGAYPVRHRTLLHRIKQRSRDIENRATQLREKPAHGCNVHSDWWRCVPCSTVTLVSCQHRTTRRRADDIIRFIMTDDAARSAIINSV
jgi:hypothetical protein